MLNLKVGQEITLYFNDKEHKSTIMQIEFGEIVWIQFGYEPANQEYYHIDELKNLMNPDNIGQVIDRIEEHLCGERL